jgi:hypothetical protein
VELAVVMGILYVAWVSPNTGWAGAYCAAFEAAAGGSSTGAIVLQLAAFAVVHSGLAFLRPYGALSVGRGM